MTKSMKFSAKFGKFMFYFGNIVIGIIFVSPLIWMISASLKPEAKIFADMDSLATFLPIQASLDNFKAEHASGIQKYFALHWPDSYF